MFRQAPIITIFENTGKILFREKFPIHTLNDNIDSLIKKYEVPNSLSKEDYNNYNGNFLEVMNAGPVEHIYCLDRFPHRSK